MSWSPCYSGDVLSSSSVLPRVLVSTLLLLHWVGPTSARLAFLFIFRLFSLRPQRWGGGGTNQKSLPSLLPSLDCSKEQKFFPFSPCLLVRLDCSFAMVAVGNFFLQVAAPVAVV